MVKTCARCGEAKDVADFYVNRRWADGRHPYCKRCLLDYQRRRRRERLDRINPNRRRWSADFVRHDYFACIDEPIRAYVAGLLAADGNVLSRQKRVSLELARRDQDLVHLVRDEVAPGFPVRGRVRPNGVSTAIFAVTSRQLCLDLAVLGITPRKSTTLTWPEGLTTSTRRFFLLGYFDGDGFITQRNGRYVYPRWALLGTQVFLDAAMRFISDETGVRRRRIRRAGQRNVHHVHITGADALAVDHWLHAGTSLGLPRRRFVQADIAASSSSPAASSCDAAIEAAWAPPMPPSNTPSR
jgi:hypothetical protein